MIHWHYIAWLIAAASFAFALLGLFGLGMASRSLTWEDYSFPRNAALVGVALILLTLVACSDPVERGTHSLISDQPTEGISP